MQSKRSELNQSQRRDRPTTGHGESETRPPHKATYLLTYKNYIVMKLNLTYTLDTLDGFKVSRSNPEEILREFKDNAAALNEIAQEHNTLYPDRQPATVNSYLDARNKYFPDGSITLYIDGDYMFYRLRTKAEVINQ